MADILKHKNTDILIVDDTPANLQLLNSVLKKEGYKVRLLPSGKMALDAINEEPPVLILLDINMPEMNGFEVCEKIKSSPATKDIPIIFLTAMTELEDVIKGFQLGAVDYITKPFNQEELLARIKTHMQLTHAKYEILELNEKLLEANQELKEWNDNLEEKVDKKTMEIYEMNKVLTCKNDALGSKDRILKFLLDFHPIDDSMLFILQEILNLTKTERILVYIVTDTKDFKPLFGLSIQDKNNLLKEKELSKFHDLPSLSKAQLKKFLSSKETMIDSINDFSVMIPLIKDNIQIGYILYDNTQKQQEVSEDCIENASDLSKMISLVVNDYLVRGSYDDLENKLENVLSDIQK